MKPLNMTIYPIWGNKLNFSFNSVKVHDFPFIWDTWVGPYQVSVLQNLIEQDKLSYRL